MPRRRLTDEERAERKRRAFSRDQFRQYDPNDSIGSGNARQWRAAAGAAVGNVDDQPVQRRNADLDMLGLTTMPTRKQELERAYRMKAREMHPDVGGSAEAFIALQDAYDRLMTRFE